MGNSVHKLKKCTWLENHQYKEKHRKNKTKTNVTNIYNQNIKKYSILHIAIWNTYNLAVWSLLHLYLQSTKAIQCTIVINSLQDDFQSCPLASGSFPVRNRVDNMTINTMEQLIFFIALPNNLYTMGTIPSILYVRAKYVIQQTWIVFTMVHTAWCRIDIGVWS